MLHFPPLPHIPEPLRGQSFVSIASTYVGPARTAEALLWSLLEAAPVAMDLMRPFVPNELGAIA